MVLQVDVISDVICPWCFIGKRRLEKAIAAFDGPVKVRWLPFQLNPLIAVKQFLGAAGQHSSDLSALPLHPWDHHAVVAGRLVAHPGDHGSLGSPLHGNALRPGNCPTSDRGCVVGDGTGQPVGEIGVISMKGQELDHRPQEVFDVLAWAFSRRRASASFFFAKPSVDRSASSSMRMRSMVAAGAHTPLEKTFRPFFSCTIQ